MRAKKLENGFFVLDVSRSSKYLDNFIVLFSLRAIYIFYSCMANGVACHDSKW